MLFNFLCSLLLLIHLAPLNGMTYLLKASFLKTQPHLSDSRLQKNFINTKRLFSSSKITPALLTGFSHKTLIVAHKTKQNEKNYRYAHTPCYQWIAGKLVDTCPFAETIDALLKAAAVTGFAAYTSSNAKESQERRENAKMEAACRMYNSSSHSIRDCQNIARLKHQQGKIGHTTSSSWNRSSPHKTFDDKVYTPAEVRALRAQGEKGLILTLDASGQPIYDDFAFTDRISDEIQNIKKEQKKRETEQTQESLIHERRAEKKPKQDKWKENNKAWTAAGASGDPHDPKNNRNNNKNHQKDYNKQNRKENSRQELMENFDQLKGSLKTQQGDHKIYAIDQNKAKALEKACGKEIGYIGADYTHNEIEVYDKKGRHLGAIDPVTRKFIPGKGPRPERNIS